MSPHVISMTREFPAEQLDGMFTEHYRNSIPHFSQQLKDKLLRGGRTDLYSPTIFKRYVKEMGGTAVAFHDILTHLMSSKIKDNQLAGNVVFIDDHVTVKSGDVYAVTSTLHLEPEVTAIGSTAVEKGFKFSFAVPSISEETIKTHLDNELESASNRHMVFTDASDAPICEHMAAVITVSATIDGQRWEPGCRERVKWVMEKKLFSIPDAFDGLIGMRANDYKTFNAKVPTHLVAGNKTAIVTVCVHAVYGTAKPEINDDLAISCGFKTIDEFTAHLTDAIKTKLDNDRAADVINKAVAEISTIFEVGPRPHAWVRMIATNTYITHLKRFKNEGECLVNYATLFGVEGINITRANVLDMLHRIVDNDIRSDLLLRKFGQCVGVEGDSSFHSMHKYVTDVKEIIKSM